MHYFPLILFCTIIYLLLTSNFEWLNILVGILIALIITMLLKQQFNPVSLRELPQTIFALIKYLGILIYDIVKGGLMVARIVWSRKVEIEPAIIAIPSECDSELATALSAHALSVSPGELVVEIGKDGVMYTHVLDAAQSSEYKDQAKKMRRDLLSKIIN